MADFGRNPAAPEFGRYGTLNVRYGKAKKGQPPRRRNVAAVMGWAVEAVADYVENVRPRMRTRALAAAGLSASISACQTRRYHATPDLQEFFAAGQDLARSGQLAWRARTASTARQDGPERAAARQDELARGRATSARRREQRLAERLTALGAATLPDYLQAAHGAGASLEELRAATGLGRERLRTAMSQAGLTPRPAARNTPQGKRSRAIAADRAAADRVGTSDLGQWLREHRAHGWTLTSLGAAVGHSSHWV